LFQVVARSADSNLKAWSGSLNLAETFGLLGMSSAATATAPPGFTGAKFSPTTGTPSSSVTLSGTNFTRATAILFNGATASFVNATSNNLDLCITAVVPLSATTGPITIVTPHGNATSTASFEVLRVFGVTG
jgi:hypothetical protein